MKSGESHCTHELASDVRQGGGRRKKRRRRKRKRKRRKDVLIKSNILTWQVGKELKIKAVALKMLKATAIGNKIQIGQFSINAL